MVEKQAKFLELICKFILALSERGYKTTCGEFFRPEFVAKIYKEQGKGIANSLHCQRLAADLNIFKDGKLIERCEEAGLLWESMSEDGHVCAWGGRFGDADHFSLAFDGRK